jgi:hypothetical protein
MKTKILYGILALLSLVLTSCFKDMEITYTGPAQVEFESTVRTSPAVGRTYPLLSSSNSVTAGPTVVTQLNLVGPQRSTDLTVRVLPETPATTAPVSSYTLLNGGNVVIPANTNAGSLSIAVARATSTTAALANLVLVIDSTSTDYKANSNYRRLGFTIRQ